MDKIRNKWNGVPLTMKVSLAYTVCSILQRCLSFITLPLFTRLLTTEQYGQYTIYQSWLGILSILLTLNLAYGSFSTAMMKFDNDRDGYISSVEGVCLVLTFLFLLVYFPLQKPLNKLFELPTPIICMMAAEIIGSTAIQLWNGKKRFEFKYKAVVTVTLCISLLSPIAAYFIVINSAEKGYARIAGYAIVNIAVGGFLYVRNAVIGKKFLNLEYWKYALKFNVPLLAYYFSQIIFNHSDRIMISHMEGTDKAAIYGVAYSLAMILTFVLNAINNAYVPWYYGKIKEGRQSENRTISLAIAGLMALLLSAVIWFAPEIILILAGEKYAQAVYVVAPVAISLLLLFYAQLFINVEFYYEEKKKLVWASIGAAVANLVLNWIFIRLYGFIAAAYTTLVSYVIFAIMNYFSMKQVLAEKGKVDDAYDYKSLLILFVVFCLMSLLGTLLYSVVIVRIIAAIFCLGVLIVKRKALIDNYKMLWRKSQC